MLSSEAPIGLRQAADPQTFYCIPLAKIINSILESHASL